MFELFAKKDKANANLLPFINIWLDRSSPHYMFSPSYIENWTSVHLQVYCWFLKCSYGFIPLEKTTLFQCLKKSMVVKPEFNEFFGLDVEAKTRALKRQELLDKRKVEHQT